MRARSLSSCTGSLRTTSSSEVETAPSPRRKAVSGASLRGALADASRSAAAGRRLLELLPRPFNSRPEGWRDRDSGPRLQSVPERVFRLETYGDLHALPGAAERELFGNRHLLACGHEARARLQVPLGGPLPGVLPLLLRPVKAPCGPRRRGRPWRPTSGRILARLNSAGELALVAPGEYLDVVAVRARGSRTFRSIPGLPCARAPPPVSPELKVERRPGASDPRRSGARVLPPPGSSRSRRSGPAHRGAL